MIPENEKHAPLNIRNDSGSVRFTANIPTPHNMITYSEHFDKNLISLAKLTTSLRNNHTHMQLQEGKSLNLSPCLPQRSPFTTTGSLKLVLNI